MRQDKLSPIANQIIERALERMEEAQRQNEQINAAAAVKNVVGVLYATIGEDFAGSNVNSALMEITGNYIEEHKGNRTA